MHWNFCTSVQYSCRWLIKMHVSSYRLYTCSDLHSPHEGGLSGCVPLQPCTKEISFEWQTNATIGMYSTSFGSRCNIKCLSVV